MERQCAPKNHKILEYGFEAPFTMALQGSTVIAPDCASLGSDTTFHCLDGPAHAADIFYAVIASRKALPRGPFTQEWLAVGHSESGLAAWAFNRREALHPTRGFLGSVAIAPAL